MIFRACGNPWNEDEDPNVSYKSMIEYIYMYKKLQGG